MILSLNFLRDYLNIDKDIDVKELADKMTDMGNEYDEARSLINATNLVIGEVLECEPHPDSDHMHVCKVNVGKDILQIVCGAPNVRKGMKVIVALNGAKLPGKDITKTVIRGVESNGMLCSLQELGIDNKFLSEEDKKGIHELDSKAKVGDDPIEYLGLNDQIIDFDLTANRGDLLSVLGMAYEVGSIYDKKVKDIDLSHKENGTDINKEFSLKINTENCKLFLTKKVENIKIKESPKDIKGKLIATGIRPINNVVDISNYVMMETGQPLHFYDYDKLKNIIEVRMAKENEKLTTLDSIERNLSSDDIVISDGKKAIGLAGVMGGLDTEVTEETKNILIEAAIFDNVKVRKTSNKILRSEASNRFEKGLDGKRTYMAIERACHLLEKLADGTVRTGTCVYDKYDKEDKKIEISVANICNVLGTFITENEIIDCFKKLDFEVKVSGKSKEYENGKLNINAKYNNALINQYKTQLIADNNKVEEVQKLIKEKLDDKEQSDILLVTVPSRRIDISIKEDLIEEIGRVYGVNKISGRTINLDLKQGKYNKAKRQIRNTLYDLGLLETLTYSLVNYEESSMFTINGKSLIANKDKDENTSIPILTPITEDRSYLRQMLATSLYKTYEYNRDRKNLDVLLYEIGKTFYKNNEEYKEEEHLAVLMTGKYCVGLDNKKVDFYIIKGIAEQVLDELGYNGRYSFEANKDFSKDLHNGISAYISVNGNIVGILGKVHPNKCKEDVYILEINLDKLQMLKTSRIKYKEISKFPTVKKDIAVIVDKNITSDELSKAIKQAGGHDLKTVTVFDVYTGKGIDEDKKSIAFNLELSSNEKTLTDEDINTTIEKIVNTLSSKFKAELRK